MGMNMNMSTLRHGPRVNVHVCFYVYVHVHVHVLLHVGFACLFEGIDMGTYMDTVWTWKIENEIWLTGLQCALLLHCLK